MQKRTFITTLLCTILLMGTLDAHQHGSFSPPEIDDLIGSSLLESSSLRMFIKIISGARNDSARTHKAKARSIRLFSNIYSQADQPVKAVMHDFVDHLMLVVRNHGFLSSTKSKRLMLLLEETKFLLHQAIKKNNTAINKADVDQLMENVYMVIGPTLGDFWRNIRRYTKYSVGAAALGYLLYSLNNSNSFIRQFMSLVGGENGLARVVSNSLAMSNHYTDAEFRNNITKAYTQQHPRGAPLPELTSAMLRTIRADQASKLDTPTRTWTIKIPNTNIIIEGVADVSKGIATAATEALTDTNNAWNQIAQRVPTMFDWSTKYADAGWKQNLQTVLRAQFQTIPEEKQEYAQAIIDGTQELPFNEFMKGATYNGADKTFTLDARHFGKPITMPDVEGGFIAALTAAINNPANDTYKLIAQVANPNSSISRALAAVGQVPGQLETLAPAVLTGLGVVDHTLFINSITQRVAWAINPKSQTPVGSRIPPLRGMTTEKAVITRSQDIATYGASHVRPLTAYQASP